MTTWNITHNLLKMYNKLCFRLCSAQSYFMYSLLSCDAWVKGEHRVRVHDISKGEICVKVQTSVLSNQTQVWGVETDTIADTEA